VVLMGRDLNHARYIDAFAAGPSSSAIVFVEGCLVF
jgi:hypothetical protein